MSDQYYDLDRDILAPHRTPPLEEHKVDYKPTDSPAPLVPYDTSTESAESDDQKRSGSTGVGKRRKGLTNRILGDRVLIRAIDPNYSALEAHASHPLEPASGGEEGVASDLEPQLMRNSTPATNAPSRPEPIPAIKTPPVLTATPAEEDGFPMLSSTFDQRHVQSPDGFANGHIEPGQDGGLAVPLKNHVNGNKKNLNLLPQPLQPRELTRDDEDSLVKSPAIGKYAITPREAHPEYTLPAFQHSPPRSSSGSAPEQRQTLPSIDTIAHIRVTHPASISGLSSATFSSLSSASFSSWSSAGFSSLSSAISRPSPGGLPPFASPASYSQPSPHSGMSPPGPPTSFVWAVNARETSTSTSSEYTSATTSTPASSIRTAPSPSAAYPTSVPAIAKQEVLAPKEEPPPPVEKPDLEMKEGGDEQSANTFGGSYKCSVPGCTASPFQTQYLLNSHANVHSNSRPHYCPVPDCPRGPGGQGFKRKNEMIRHGLVHISPGYICPFCPDQQHKYPRPDNLQRHVRVHHEDRNKDDPALREVLNQRPEGGNRGRRRRLGS